MDVNGNFIAEQPASDVITRGKRKTLSSSMNEPIQKHSNIHRPIAAAFGAAPRRRFGGIIQDQPVISASRTSELSEVASGAIATPASQQDTKEKRIDDYFPHEYSSFGVSKLFSAPEQKKMEPQMDICTDGTLSRCTYCSGESFGDKCSFCSKILCPSCQNICEGCEFGFCGQCSTIL